MFTFNWGFNDSYLFVAPADASFKHHNVENLIYIFGLQRNIEFYSKIESTHVIIVF